MPLLIAETFTNATKGYIFGEGEPYEPFTDNPGKLFRYGLKEYGRCTSSIYISDTKGDHKIGWVFQKRMEYEDARPDWPASERYYIREVWVTLYDAPDTVTRERHYHFLPL